MENKVNKSDIKKCVDTATRLNLYKSNPEKLYEQLKTFDKKTLDSIRTQGIENPGPINQLRVFVATLLLNNEPISKEIIEQKRDEIGTVLPKNAFKAYKNPFSIFFPFLIDPTQQVEKQLLISIVEQIKKLYNLEYKTSHRIVDFNGSQNFGSDRIWFAIYNKSHKNQRTAQQLFFELNSNGIFLSHYDRPNNNHIKELFLNVEEFDIEKIALFFQPFISTIVEDYFMVDAALSSTRNIYKISHGVNVINDFHYHQLLDKQIVIVHEDTASLASSSSTQFEDFESILIGDYFYLCRSNDEIVLIGQFTTESHPCEIEDLSQVWYQRKYKIIHNCIENNGYSGPHKKWWMPNFNSTCRIIPKLKDEYQLANNEIFIPFFGITIQVLFSSEENNKVIDTSDSEVDLLHGGLFRIKDNRVSPSLGVEILAAQFAGIVSNLEENTGQVLGVFGPWGRGKTYFIEQVCKALKINYHTLESEKDSPFYFTKFHAWKYQDTEGVWAYLYEQIADSYYNHLNKEEWETPKKSQFFWRLKKIFVFPILKWNNERKLLFRLNAERHGYGDIYLFVFSFSMIFINSYIVHTAIEKYSESILNIVNVLFSFLASFSAIRIIYKLYNIGQKGKRIVQKYTERPTYNHLLGIQAEIQNELKWLLSAWIKIRIKRKQPIIGWFNKLIRYFWESPKNEWKEELSGSKKRLLLFVDDVDRCSEDRLIQVVDSLRILLEDEEIAKRLIVVTAVDERILSRAILWKYQDIIKPIGKNDVLGDNKSENEKLNQPLLLKEYMDKLFITGIKLPPLTSDDRFSILMNYAKDGDFLQSIDESILENNTENFEETEKYNSGIQGPDDFDEEVEEDIKNSGGNIENKQAKKDFLLTTNELKWIHTEMSGFTDFTPRQIRIIMYRYMFAKSLVIEYYGRNRLNSIWSNYLVKEIICKSMNTEYSFDENRLNELDFKDQELIRFTPKLIEIVVPY